MASANFTNLAKHMAKGNIDFDTATFKVMLVNAIPSASDLDSWEYRAAVTSEVTGAGYTAGGISQPYTLGSLDTTDNFIPVDYTSISNGWTSATISAVGAIIYLNTGSAATDILLHFLDFGGTVSVTSGNFSISYTSAYRIYS